MTLVASRSAPLPADPQRHAPLVVADERRPHARRDAARKLEDGIRLQVHAGVLVVQHRLGRDDRRLPPGDADEVDGVAPDVHERPATQIAVEADVARLHDEMGDAVVELHALHLAEHARGEHLEQPAREAVQSVVEPHESAPPRSIRGVGDLRRGRAVRRQRLLAQHVLAALQRSHGPMRLHGRGERDVDEVDVRMVQDHVVVAGLGHPEAIGQRQCPLGIAGADRDHAHAVQLASGLHDRTLGDARRTQDSDAKWLLSHGRPHSGCGDVRRAGSR